MILAFAVRTYGVYVRITAFAVAKAAVPYRVGPTHRTRVPLRARLVLLLKVRVRTIAVAVASARTRYLHCCFSRLFVVFYVKGIEFLDGDDFVVPDLSILVITI